MSCQHFQNHVDPAVYSVILSQRLVGIGTVLCRVARTANKRKQSTITKLRHAFGEGLSIHHRANGSLLRTEPGWCRGAGGALLSKLKEAEER